MSSWKAIGQRRRVLLISKPTASRIAMVHVLDPRVRWSVPASQVTRIMAATDWLAAPPLDVLAALGPVSGPAAGRRVMIVRGAADRETALFAAGPISIADVDPGDVLALPAEVAHTAPQISAIVVAHDAQLSLLFDPLAIAHPDAVVREEP
ncbi:MAG TPA: hypothetical protein VFK02_21720 [Kofleriaceae bacterium]|nr:hypothetical protein [Kofleriaceae bacterium]